MYSIVNPYKYMDDNKEIKKFIENNRQTAISISSKETQLPGLFATPYCIYLIVVVRLVSEI